MAINGIGRPSKIDPNKLREMFYAGISVYDIGVELGVGHQAVSAACIRRGWKRSPLVKRNLARVSKIGSQNPMWVGDNAKPEGLHRFIRRRVRQPARCQNCKLRKNKLDLANISGKYKRDLNDWIFLCRSCHMKLDGRFENRNVGKFLKGEYLSLSLRK